MYCVNRINFSTERILYNRNWQIIVLGPNDAHFLYVYMSSEWFLCICMVLKNQKSKISWKSKIT